MRKKILVIDDDEAVRKSFTLALQSTEYEVYTSSSGEGGIKMVRETGFDMIYLDLKMSGMSGVETLRELRKIDSKIPVYIITAYYESFFDELNRARAEGLTFQIIKKPIGRDKIISITKGILEKPAAY